MTTVDDCRIVEFPRIIDERGNLSFAQNLDQVPFEIKRVYWLYDVPGGESRGSHAHRQLEQLIVAAGGSFTVTLDDGRNRKTFFLNRPYQGLYVPAGIWRDLYDFSSGSVCMVMASAPYVEDDYLREYDEFLEFRQTVKL